MRVFQTWCVAGGVSKDPIFLAVVGLERVPREFVDMVQLDSRAAWLAKLTGATQRDGRFSTRSKIVNTIKKEAQKERHTSATAADSLGPKDPMQELLEEEGPPVKKKMKRVGEAKKCNESWHSLQMPARCPLLPSSANAENTSSANAEAIHITVSHHAKQHAVFIDVASVEWLAEYIKAELDMGGVAAVQQDEVQEERGVDWCFREDAWRARAFPKGKPVLTKWGCVKRLIAEPKSQYFNMPFEEAKAKLHAELACWKTTVENASCNKPSALPGTARDDGFSEDTRDRGAPDQA